ncbi:MAG: NAD(+) diphosphatase [Ktedonobacteraceae bacterium]|nr:NAD(+) diphosphatase [Ktedonobacteraceae bacterium]
MASHFQRAYPPAQPTTSQVRWFPFQGHKLLVREQNGQLALLHGEDLSSAGLNVSATLYIGTLDDTSCMACEVSSEQELPAGWREVDLRALFGQVDDITYAVAGYASVLLLWQRSSRFCPVCGSATRQEHNTWGRHCPDCGTCNYPPVTPAVLVLIHDGDRVLLTHKPGWGKRYSVIAGFVEPGETLEECARREVLEEVGVEVTDVTYKGSQPWPFPHQLMLAFTVRYVSGEPRPDLEELDDAAWFAYDALPELPAPLSLSYQLIAQWVSSRQKTSHNRI